MAMPKQSLNWYAVLLRRMGDSVVTMSIPLDVMRIIEYNTGSQDDSPLLSIVFTGTKGAPCGTLPTAALFADVCIGGNVWRVRV